MMQHDRDRAPASAIDETHFDSLPVENAQDLLGILSPRHPEY